MGCGAASARQVHEVGPAESAVICIVKSKPGRPKIHSIASYGYRVATADDRVPVAYTFKYCPAPEEDELDLHPGVVPAGFAANVPVNGEMLFFYTREGLSGPEYRAEYTLPSPEEGGPPAFSMQLEWSLDVDALWVEVLQRLEDEFCISEKIMDSLDADPLWLFGIAEIATQRALEETDKLPRLRCLRRRPALEAKWKALGDAIEARHAKSLQDTECKQECYFFLADDPALLLVRSFGRKYSGTAMARKFLVDGGKYHIPIGYHAIRRWGADEIVFSTRESIFGGPEFLIAYLPKGVDDTADRTVFDWCSSMAEVWSMFIDIMETRLGRDVRCFNQGPWRCSGIIRDEVQNQEAQLALLEAASRRAEGEWLAEEAAEDLELDSGPHEVDRPEAQSTAFCLS